MSELEYPLGMASFPELIEEGYVYVDKTAYKNFSLQDGLERHLDGLLRDLEKTYTRDPEDETPARRFRHLIEAAYENRAALP